MKKTFTLTLILFFALAANAQKRALPATDYLKIEVKTDTPPEYDGVNFPVFQGPLKLTTNFTEHTIGETVYDLQTNGCLNKRIHAFPDGTVGATWTRGITPTAFSDRGTGYNYFDGSTWGAWPTQIVESVKSGWPTYAPVGPTGEMIISHDAVTKLLINRRAVKGTGEWQETFISGPPGNEKVTWPAAVTTGPDNNHVHLLGIIRDGYLGQPQTLGYWRSLDGADTWDIQYEVLEGTGADYYTTIGADDAVWAEPRANTLAFVCASVWHDLFMMKSTDNGDTWEKTVIWEHPYPFYNENTVCDTFYTVDYSANIALDNEGMAHVVFGITRVRKDAVGTSYSYYKNVDGIGYWNETMPTFSNDLYALSPYGDGELIENYNLIGWSQDTDGNGELEFAGVTAYRSHGLSTMPYLVIDENNFMYLAYSSVTEGFVTVTGDMNFRHIWMRFSPDLGASWGDFVDLQGNNIFHLYDECIYPHMAEVNDEYIHILYNVDISPGLAQREDHDWQSNQQTHIKILTQIFIGINENDMQQSTLEVSQNFPNPANGITTFSVKNTEPATLKLSVRNVNGQLVFEDFPKDIFAGTHHMRINTANYKPGVYFYTVDDGKEMITRKMIVE